MRYGPPRVSPREVEAHHEASSEPRPASAKRERRPFIKGLISLALAAVALVIGGATFVSLASLKEPPVQTPPPERVFRVPVFVAQEMDVRTTVQAFGTAASDRRVTVAAEVAGRIVDSSALEVGNRVSPILEGADEPAPPLVRIDPETYRQRLLQAEARIRQAEAEIERLDQEIATARVLRDQKQESVASAKAQLDVQQRLASMGAGRESEIRRAELEYQQQVAGLLQLEGELKLETARRNQIQAQLAAHQQDLELARLDVQRAAIAAPFSGSISAVFVEDGQYVKVGDPLFEITNLDRVEIPLPVPVSRVHELAELLDRGEFPRVQLAEHETAQCRWMGSIRRIAPAADATTRTVDVYAEVENRDSSDLLRPGTFVHARIEAGELAGVILIPRDVLINDRVFLAEPTLQSSQQATAASRRVTVGRSLQGFVEITSGIRPGELVVMSNLDVLRDGSHLRIAETRTTSDELQRQKVPGFEILAENGRPMTAARAPFPGKKD